MVLHVQAVCKSFAVAGSAVSNSSLVLGQTAEEMLQKGVEFVVGDRDETCKKLMELVCVTEGMKSDVAETVGKLTSLLFKSKRKISL